MKLVTGSQMADIDRRAGLEYGIPGIVLMENAGLAVVRTAEDMTAAGLTVILCGRGNNGGDGMVVARHLANRGRRVSVYLLGDPAGLAGDALTNYEIVRRMGLPVKQLQTENDVELLRRELAGCALVIDALFGTGFHGTLEGIAAQVVNEVNRAGAPVLAVDIPSGLDAATGRAYGPVVRADRTVTMALPKVGLVVGDGPSWAGEMVVADISMPVSLLKDPDISLNMTTEDDVRNWFGPRRPDSHKGTYGHVLVAGGSPGLTGAVIMASAAALRAGAGVVTAMVPHKLADMVDAHLVEVMTRGLPSTDADQIAPAAVPGVLEMAGRASCLVLGPGMGRYDTGFQVVAELLEGAGVPVVLDADGLNALAGRAETLRRASSPVIITPHPGEMSRLTGMSVAEIEADRIGTARRFAGEWQVTVVLKGYRTVIASPEGEAWVNTTGNAGMATAGSGDVLAGVIGALLAQGIPPVASAYAGVYIHGKAGDAGAAARGQRGLTALDIVESLPRVLQGWEE